MVYYYTFPKLVLLLIFYEILKQTTYSFENPPVKTKLEVILDCLCRNISLLRATFESKTPERTTLATSSLVNKICIGDFEISCIESRIRAPTYAYIYMYTYTYVTYAKYYLYDQNTI